MHLQASPGSTLWCYCSQGFAPHWDDIDAFVLQIEGAKRWRLHPHLDEGSKLPRFSSADFAPKDLAEPFLDTVLEPGDLLYMPRGLVLAHMPACTWLRVFATLIALFAASTCIHACRSSPHAGACASKLLGVQQQLRVC